MSPSPSATRGCVSSAMRGQGAARLALAAGDRSAGCRPGRCRPHLPSGRAAGHADSRIRARPHRACAGSGRRAPRCARRHGAATAIDFDARHVGGEAGHRDAPAQSADQHGQTLAHLGLGAGVALHHRIGGVADHRQHALRPSASSAASSVGGPISGSGSSFQSPVCSRMPCGVSDHQRLGLGDRMGDADEAQRERRQIDAIRRATTCIFTWLSNRTSASLRRSTAAANGVA